MPKFDARFELDVLGRAAVDPAFRLTAKRVLATHNFTDKRYGWLWETMDRLGTGDKLSAAVAIAAAKKASKVEDDRTELIGVALKVLRHAPLAPKAALKEITDFAQVNRLSTAMEKSIKALDRGAVDEATAALREARATDALAYDGSDWITTLEERMAIRKARAEDPTLRACIPTKIPSLDKVLHGIEPGELGLIVATTGRGKSHMAVHLSYWAGILGYNVAHVVTEMTKEQVMTRFDSRALGIPYDDLRFHRLDASDLDLIKAKMDKISAKLANHVHVSSTPIRRATLDTLEQLLDDCAAEGHEIDMLVVDSGDHLKPSEYDKDRRNREANNYWDLKSIAVERGIGVWTTTQASKEVVNKIAKAENVSEAYDKARIGDILWTLNQTPAQAEADIMTGLLAKYRSGKTGTRVTLKVDLSRSLFEEVDASEDPDAARDDDDDE